MKRLFNNKPFSIFVLILALYNLAIAIYTIASGSLSHLLLYSPISFFWTIGASVVSVILLFALSIAIKKNNHDKKTKATILLFVIFNLSLPAVLLAIYMFRRERAKNVEKVKKHWFLPGTIGTVGILISLLTGGAVDILSVLSFALNIYLYLGLGYWISCSLDIIDINSKDQLAYYDDLHKKGALSKEELEKKTTEIMNNIK